MPSPQDVQINEPLKKKSCLCSYFRVLDLSSKVTLALAASPEERDCRQLCSKTPPFIQLVKFSSPYTNQPLLAAAPRLYDSITMSNNCWGGEQVECTQGGCDKLAGQAG